MCSAHMIPPDLGGPGYLREKQTSEGGLNWAAGLGNVSVCGRALWVVAAYISRVHFCYADEIVLHKVFSTKARQY